MDGASATVPKPTLPKVAASQVSVHLSGKDTDHDALTLQWKDAWYASLRLEGGTPLDLRPYLANGVLAFDINVDDLADGGLSFNIDCGSNCSRKIPYLVAARALQGKGWQHLVFSIQCFLRNGDDFSAINGPFTMDGSGSGTVSLANIEWQQSGTPNTTCPDYKTVSVIPDLQNESWSMSWWLPRHQEKLDEIKRRRNLHINTEIVFIGDSITEGWAKSGQAIWDRYYKKYRGFNLGFGGDRTENVLWRIQHGEIDGLNPNVAVLMLGTNNTGSRLEDPVTTAAGIKRNLEELRLRLPNTKILVLAIFPRGENPDNPLRLINEHVNQIASGFADNKHIFFANINHVFLTIEGILSKDIMPDLLHPNEKGYAIWADAMQPTLLQLMPQPIPSAKK